MAELLFRDANLSDVLVELCEISHDPDAVVRAGAHEFGYYVRICDYNFITVCMYRFLFDSRGDRSVLQMLLLNRDSIYFKYGCRR